MKKINTGYNISNAKKYLITPKITNSNDAGKSSKISLTHVSPDNQKSISSLNKQQSSDRKEFSKINDIRYKKLLSQIDKYKQTNSSVKIIILI